MIDAAASLETGVARRDQCLVELGRKTRASRHRFPVVHPCPGAGTANAIAGLDEHDAGTQTSCRICRAETTIAGSDDDQICVGGQ